MPWHCSCLPSLPLSRYADVVWALSVMLNVALTVSKLRGLDPRSSSYALQRTLLLISAIKYAHALHKLPQCL